MVLQNEEEEQEERAHIRYPIGILYVIHILCSNTEDFHVLTRCSRSKKATSSSIYARDMFCDRLDGSQKRQN